MIIVIDVVLSELEAVSFMFALLLMHVDLCLSLKATLLLGLLNSALLLFFLVATHNSFIIWIQSMKYKCHYDSDIL